MSVSAPAIVLVPEAASIPIWLMVLIAAACGLITANIYLGRPLIGPITAVLALAAATGGLIPTMSAARYGAGLLRTA